MRHLLLLAVPVPLDSHLKGRGQDNQSDRRGSNVLQESVDPLAARNGVLNNDGETGLPEVAC